MEREFLRDALRHIYLTDPDYRAAHYAFAEARANVEQASALAVAAREMGDVAEQHRRMEKELELLTPFRIAEVELHRAAMAALKKWLEKAETMPRFGQESQTIEDKP